MKKWFCALLLGMLIFLLGSAAAELSTNLQVRTETDPDNRFVITRTYVDKDGLTWAKRFVLFIDKVELCNGYTELTDAAEQRRRFEADLELRRRANKPLPPMDERFLAALESGMPACSGVALGLDRLFMLALGKAEIADVILFPSPVA